MKKISSSSFIFFQKVLVIFLLATFSLASFHYHQKDGEIEKVQSAQQHESCFACILSYQLHNSFSFVSSEAPPLSQQLSVFLSDFFFLDRAFLQTSLARAPPV